MVEKGCAQMSVSTGSKGKHMLFGDFKYKRGQGITWSSID